MKTGIGYGKILLVGGYTVLVHPNRSLVFSVKNARIRALAEPHPQWVVVSRYGISKERDPRAIPDSLRFVRHAILEAGVGPHYIRIQEEGLFRKEEKLGLGSSAAVTVAVLKALRNDLDHRELFRRAYRAHSVAQGKIGSGFDIAASVYGSVVYRRPIDEKGSDFYALPIKVPEEIELRYFNVKGKGNRDGCVSQESYGYR